MHSLNDGICVQMTDEYKDKSMDIKRIESLKPLRKLKINMIVVTHLNIHSLRNKLDSLIEQNVDILVISKTKLDSSFRTGQLLLNGYS